MKHFLTEEQYRQLQQRIAEGETRLIIPASVSRQFFLRVDNKSIKATTNESAITQKLTVWLGALAAPLLFGVCAVLIAVTVGASNDLYSRSIFFESDRQFFLCGLRHAR